MGGFMRSEPLLQIAFLTGQSDPQRCALSEEQRLFLQQLHGHGRRLLDCNYPYRPDGAAHRRVPLWRASAANARQYLAARSGPVAPPERAAVITQLEPVPLTLLLVGSCGLQLLAALHLPAPLRARVAVFAYGPVANALAPFERQCIVQGRRDWISRALYRGPVDMQPACGHMDYLCDSTVRAACKAFASEVEQAGRRGQTCASI
ncbi:hypothetical protein [Xanthomonas campestris]|uniref:hypothetical protein n=1 Tax=Xanthomonas campestris TaxID=339 RepID=UPI00236798F7|nr:hypothetical protein [Xanthomonas campestris]MEA9559305.1 hypothetical protein [Xanthomonas campestris]MEA9722217.1 hypothetical protein [Xanthomonas campestris]MEB1884467.1 hypothetical protein [Xanthomonas campestris pv. campestris]WDK84657.1 hypothetical protein JH311_08415 [Xanthomonas campestris pv. campestris]WDK85800.1 hypothetical protein JH305_13290 [Xanthomonas campestris pv. campestris]